MTFLDDEGEFEKRPLPQHRYAPSGRILYLPRSLPNALTAIFRPYAERHLEACCFLFGEESDRTGRVKLIAIPSQRNTWGNYHVPAESTKAMAMALMGKRLVNLAQVHTHPGQRVEHSNYDDLHANSQRALSLVLPLYGTQNHLWPAGVGVHENQLGYWHLLPAPAVDSTLVFDTQLHDPEILDLR